MHPLISQCLHSSKGAQMGVTISLVQYTIQSHCLSTSQYIRTIVLAHYSTPRHIVLAHHSTYAPLSQLITVHLVAFSSTSKLQYRPSNCTVCMYSMADLPGHPCCDQNVDFQPKQLFSSFNFSLTPPRNYFPPTAPTSTTLHLQLHC